MCYSALVKKKMREYEREFGVRPNFRQFELAFGFHPYEGRLQIPRAFEDWFSEPATDEERRIWDLIVQYRAKQESALQQEMFAQLQRVNDAQRALQTKVTKKAENDVRVGTKKAEQAKAKIADLKRTEPKTQDARIFPFSYAPIIIEENGERQIVLARYHCRGVGKPASIDKERDGLYNARRDNIEAYWRNEFGKTHAICLFDSFFEHVEQNGKNAIIQFKPQSDAGMIVACVYAKWTDPKGIEPDLLSFAAITDEPPEEIRSAGHDRCPINLKRQNVDAWLTPQGRSVAELQNILGDVERPYYEHRAAEAA